MAAKVAHAALILFSSFFCMANGYPMIQVWMSYIDKTGSYSTWRKTPFFAKTGSDAKILTYFLKIISYASYAHFFLDQSHWKQKSCKKLQDTAKKCVLRIFENWNFWTAIWSEVTCRLQKWKPEENWSKIATARANLLLFRFVATQHFRFRKNVPIYIYATRRHYRRSREVVKKLQLLPSRLCEVCKFRKKKKTRATSGTEWDFANVANCNKQAETSDFLG